MNISNIQRDNELNERIKQRNMIYVNTNINLGNRPESTKYGYKPIIDRPVSQKVPIERTETFNVNTHFLPGNRQGPWDGFATHIHDESRLRNLFFANTLCQQGLYIPSSNSDLYKSPKITGRKHETQKFPYLFNTPQLHKENKPLYKENKVFNNNSRQMRLNEHK
tara:strand:+ start:9113 stop:9607 length:495 start_codon:yes stop_codon:yes gene_type:complete